MIQADETSKGAIGTLNRAFGLIAGACFTFRWAVLAASLLLAGLSFQVASQIEGDASYEHYFHPGDTTYQAYETYREDFGSDEVSYVGYEVKGLEHGPWNVEAMAALVSLTEAIEDEVPFIYEVTSLANAELTVGTEDGIEISKIVDDWPLSQAELLERREAYLRKPMLVGGIINEEADFGALILEMDRSSTDPPEEILAPPEQRPFPEEPTNVENLYPQVTDAKIAEILARPEYAAYEFYHSGDVPINAYYNRILFVEPFVLLGVAILIIAVILAVTFRSVIAVLAPIAVIVLSLLATVAIMAALGFKIGMGFGSTPTLLTAIGVAHSVHILSEFRSRFSLGRDRRRALVETMTLVGVPCLLTSVTTAVGFASMSFGPIRTLAEGGVINSIGVLMAYVFSMTLLMSLLSIDWLWAWRKLRGIESEVSAGSSAPSSSSSSSFSAGVVDSRAKGGDWMRSALDRITQINIDHRGTLLTIFSVFLVVFGIGATRVEVDSNYLKDFWKSSWIYKTTVKVDSEMGGTTNVVYLFDAGEDDGIKNPEVLREIDRIQQLANAEDWLVTKTYSIVDIVKDLNQSFHGDDPAYYAIPETREAVAQYLLLYESSGGEEAEEYVTSDYRRANLELRLKMDATASMQRLVAGLDADLEAVPPQNSTVSLTGIGALWLVLMDYIVTSQVQGLTMAFAIITLVMIGIFRSFKIGLISMVPNLAPIFLALGAMGWFGISLDYTKAGLAAIVLGISVDDTIHLMTRFHHEFGKSRNYERALRASLGDVGRALLITSIALVFGFCALIFSEMRNQAFYGILLSSSLVAALVADFFFMPALVLKFKPFGPEGMNAGSDSGEALS